MEKRCLRFEPHKRPQLSRIRRNRAAKYIANFLPGCSRIITRRAIPIRGTFSLTFKELSVASERSFAQFLGTQAGNITFVVLFLIPALLLLLSAQISSSGLRKTGGTFGERSGKAIFGALRGAGNRVIAASSEEFEGKTNVCLSLW